MEVYAAMIEIMDQGIGRIVDQLKTSNQLDDTLILFLQDNGGCAENTGRRPMEAPAPDGLKPLGPDGLQTRVIPIQTRDGRPVRQGPGVMPGPADTYIAYGRGWANVSNTPFREYKHWVHEGGISTPLIAHWPAGIKAERAGAFERQPGHLIDVMATCVDLAGATYPIEKDGKPIKPREGVSLRPAFNGEPLARTQPLFWEHEGNRAVREGEWKLVAKANQPWELYNIADDRAELHDLASSQPDRVKDMTAKWDAYAARADVLPLGAWRDPAAGPGRLSARRRFELEPGARLARGQAPAVANKGFTITAEFEAAADHPKGVIVAQGGAALGYSLFLAGGRPRFLVRAPGGVSRIAGPSLRPATYRRRQARLQRRADPGRRRRPRRRTRRRQAHPPDARRRPPGRPRRKGRRRPLSVPQRLQSRHPLRRRRTRRQVKRRPTGEPHTAAWPTTTGGCRAFRRPRRGRRRRRSTHTRRSAGPP